MNEAVHGHQLSHVNVMDIIFFFYEIEHVWYAFQCVSGSTWNSHIDSQTYL